MTNHVECEPTRELAEPANRVSELTADEMKHVAGGFLVFQFKLVAVKTVGWAHDDN